MEKLPQDVWVERCVRRIAEVERGIGIDEARRLARADRGRFERRSSPRH